METYSFKLIMNIIFYRLKYISKNQRSGYFLVKRKWVWFLCSPILIIPYILLAVVEYFVEIFNYTYNWINTGNKKLTRKTRIKYRKILMK